MERKFYKEDNISKKPELIPVRIYSNFHGTFLEIGNKSHCYDMHDRKLDKPIDGEIDKYETMLKKLCHEDRVRYLNGIAKMFIEFKPDFLVAKWLEAKVREERVITFNEVFEYKGKEDEVTIAKLKEELNDANAKIRELETQAIRDQKKIEDYIVERTRMEDSAKSKFVFDRNNSIELTLRERVVIMTGIMRMIHEDKDGEVSANLSRLIDNGETVKRYMKELKSKGDRPLTDEEKEHVRKFYGTEGLDTSYILDYIN